MSDIPTVPPRYVKMVDDQLNYVLCELEPYSFWLTGLHQRLTVSANYTYTKDYLTENYPEIDFTDESVPRGTFDAQRNIWTFPVVTEENKFYGF
jgi:hypothetical protein